MAQKNPFFKTGKGIALLGFIIITLIGVPFTIIFLQQQQIFLPKAWFTSQSASSACRNGVAVIDVSFTNTEKDKSNAMVVTVSDPQTGGHIDLGTVNAQTTKHGTITTKATSLKAGDVIFSLTWAGNTPGKDTRTASYKAVTTCVVPKPTPTPTPKPKLTPTLTPTLNPTTTITIVPTITPTITSIPLPTVTPTTPPIIPTVPPTTNPTTFPTSGPTSTIVPPIAIVTTAPRTPIVVVSNPPPTVIVRQPTIAPTGSDSVLVGFGAISVLLTAVGGLILILL